MPEHFLNFELLWISAKESIKACLVRKPQYLDLLPLSNTPSGHGDDDHCEWKGASMGCTSPPPRESQNDLGKDSVNTISLVDRFAARASYFLSISPKNTPSSRGDENHEWKGVPVPPQWVDFAAPCVGVSGANKMHASGEFDIMLPVFRGMVGARRGSSSPGRISVNWGISKACPSGVGRVWTVMGGLSRKPSQGSNAFNLLILFHIRGDVREGWRVTSNFSPHARPRARMRKALDRGKPPNPPNPPKAPAFRTPCFNLSALSVFP